ncbi:uncharacterized protein MYCGRDRAFT_102534, partial [Zymoseptoria tritici IPO323]
IEEGGKEKSPVQIRGHSREERALKSSTAGPSRCGDHQQRLLRSHSRPRRHAGLPTQPGQSVPAPPASTAPFFRLPSRLPAPTQRPHHVSTPSHVPTRPPNGAQLLRCSRRGKSRPRSSSSDEYAHGSHKHCQQCRPIHGWSGVLRLQPICQFHFQHHGAIASRQQRQHWILGRSFNSVVHALQSRPSTSSRRCRRRWWCWIGHGILRWE